MEKQTIRLMIGVTSRMPVTDCLADILASYDRFQKYDRGNKDEYYYYSWDDISLTRLLDILSLLSDQATYNYCAIAVVGYHISRYGNAQVFEMDTKTSIEIHSPVLIQSGPLKLS